MLYTDRWEDLNDAAYFSILSPFSYNNWATLIIPFYSFFIIILMIIHAVRD
jgi:hypothetical protein